MDFNFEKLDVKKKRGKKYILSILHNNESNGKQ